MADDGWTVVEKKSKPKPKPKQAKAGGGGGGGGGGGARAGGGGGGVPAVDPSLKKFNAATNKQHKAPSNARKIEEIADVGDDSLAVKKVSLNVAKSIQQARQAANLSQKDLATKINEKASVINDYESGRAQPDSQVLGKLERALGVKLRGKA